MSSISSIGGNTDLETFVYQSLASERKPIQELESSKSDLRKKEQVYNDLKSKLRELNNITKDLIAVGVGNKLRAKKAESGDSKYFTAETTQDAEKGTNSVFIDNMASRDIAVSSQLTKNDTSLLPQGTQQFSIGTGTEEPTLLSISIEEGDTNETILNKIADKINDAGLNVRASVIYDSSSTVRLSLKSSDTGSEHAISLSDEEGSDLFTILGFQDINGERNEASGTGGGFIKANVEDLNARVTIDGISISAQNNSIENVIKGVVINLHAAQSEGEPALNLKVTPDVETTKKEIQEFIEKYNEIVNYIAEKSKIDTTTNERGYLAGDASYFQLKFNLRWYTTGPVAGVKEGNPYLLSEIGVQMNKDGTLKIGDTDKLTEMIENNDEAVYDIFNLEDGIGNRITSLLENFIKTGGVVDTSKKLISQKIENIDERIDSYEQILLVREEDLRRKFIELQKILSSLQSQQSIMNNNLFTYSGNAYGLGYY